MFLSTVKLCILVWKYVVSDFSFSASFRWQFKEFSATLCALNINLSCFIFNKSIATLRQLLGTTFVFVI